MLTDGQRENQKKKLSKTLSFLYRLVEVGLKCVYPPRCPVCDELLSVAGREKIHSTCEKELKIIMQPKCFRCGQSMDNVEEEYCFDCMKKLQSVNPISQGRGIFDYSGKAKLMMYHFKYSNRGCYKDYFAMMSARLYFDWFEKIAPDVIIPIPMYWRKQRWRGYNQATEFAKALGKALNIPVDTKVVVRRRNTRALKSLSPEERKNNLKNAFHVKRSIVKYRKILLVDDIYTTGSTVETVADHLLRAGAAEVYFFTVCVGKGF